MECLSSQLCIVAEAVGESDSVSRRCVMELDLCPLRSLLWPLRFLFFSLVEFLRFLEGDGVRVVGTSGFPNSTGRSPCRWNTWRGDVV